MKRRYTVTWSRSANSSLARLWLENPAIRREITDAADAIDSTLAYEPNSIGEDRGGSRFVVRVPLAILFRVIEADQQVRVIYVTHWTDLPAGHA